MSLRFAVLTIILAIISVSLAFGQEYESAGISSLAGVSLPAGARRLLPAQIPVEFDQTLEKIVARGEGKLRRSGTEVLVWPGSRSVADRLAGNLRSVGWHYEVSGAENGVTFFTALKDGAERRAIIGFHGETEDAFFLAWTELKENTGDQHKTPSKSNSATTGTATPAPGRLPGYEFTTPAGWSRQDAADKVILSKDDDKLIAFLPLMDSSGDLARDAELILWQVLKGHNTWYGNGFTPDYGTFERGRTIQGLEYFQAYRYAKKASDPNEGFVQSRFDAVILVVKVGDKVAVAVGRQPFQTPNYSDSAITALDRILYDLTISSVQSNYNLKGELLGSWSAASNTVALAYTFNPNGSFNKGGAHQFRVGHDATRDKVTTTSYGLTESYTVAGNLLTMNYKRTGQATKFKARVYETKYDKDPWKQRLGLLPLSDNSRGETIVLTKSE